MLTNYKVNGVDLDQIFDPYVSGTKPAATGYKVNGVDLRDIFAPRYLGTTAAITHYTVNGVDLNQIFAAKGSVVYSLPINGQTFISAVNITSGSASASIGFRIVSGNTWQVYKYNSLTSTSVLASGAIPGSSTTVQFTFGTYTVGVGFADAGGSTSNGAASAVAVSGNPDARYTTNTNTATSGSRDREYPFAIVFRDASGTVISSTNITLIGDTEGSI